MEPTVKIVDDAGNETVVDETGAETRSPADEVLDLLQIDGKDPDLERLSEEKIVVVEDDDPILQEQNQPNNQPAGPGQPNFNENSAVAQMQAQLAEFMEAQKAKEAKAEREAAATKIQTEINGLAKEHNDLVRKKSEIMSNKAYYQNGVLTPQAAQTITSLDSKIYQLNAEHVAKSKELDEAKKEPEPEVKVPQEVAQWMQENAWINDPRNHQMRQAAIAIENHYKSLGYAPDNRAFWDAVKGQLEADGWQVPKINSQDPNNPPIYTNRFSGPGPAGGGNPAARRQQSQPTTGVGRSPETNTGSNQRNWSALERRLAKEFGNASGERAKLLDKQYKTLGKR